MFLETLYRIYSTAGYNIAHVDVTAQLCAEHNIRYEDVERVEAVVNWLETQYPSPAFPSRREDAAPRPGSTPYYTAYGVVKRGFPVLRGQGVAPTDADDPPEVLELMQRVTIIPSHQMTLFGPRITIYTDPGGTVRSHHRDLPRPRSPRSRRQAHTANVKARVRPARSCRHMVFQSLACSNA